MTNNIDPAKTAQDKRQYTRWTADEWIGICCVLHSRFPNATAETVFTVKEIREAAQSALPADRQRKSFNAATEQANVNTHWPRMLEQQNKVEEKSADDNTESDTALPNRLSDVVFASAISALTPPADSAKADQYRTAFEPLVQMLGRELANAMIPVLVPALTAALKPMIGNVKPIIEDTLLSVLAPSQRKELSAPAAAAKVEVPAHLELRRKPRVAIVGGMARTHNSIKAAFPRIDFVFVSEHRPGVRDSIMNCDKVIAVIDKSSHTLSAMAKSSVERHKFHQVAGSASAIKRQIEVLIATKGLILPPVVNTAPEQKLQVQ